jgi:hypothetical protein
MYPIYRVPTDAYDLLEPIGSKFKFWFESNKYLFKEAREDTGEDWAEKVACELCVLLGIPHAHYELAEWRGRKGVVTVNFRPEQGGLLLGNQLLMRIDSGYPGTKLRGVRQHTIRIVLRAIEILMECPPGFVPFPGVTKAVDVFIGYIMLDAWIGNNDRHHQNWGLVFITEEGLNLHLAPSFDHASCLGRIETDDEKRERLTTRDKNRTVEAYTAHTFSRFYASPSNTKSLTTMEAFWLAAKSHPAAALAWLKRLQGISSEEIDYIFDEVPTAKISDISKEFAKRVLDVNRQQLLGMIGPLIA